jgi:tRNA nucleotidyltransferase (CCA-adding enzyme)
MPDYMFMLESRLSPEQRAALLRVQELAAATGTNVYLTGGTVRDLITGAPLRDLDFTVEGNPFRIVKELEKGGAKIVSEDERLRQVEMVFAGDCDGSLAAARDEVYVRPGTKPEIRWSTIMEDLRRRDFSINAIAISLNPASRGLLLDPTNGLGDIEKSEIRALSIHSFTNQPVRLLRALRYAARLGYKLEARTAEWYELALERDLHHAIPVEDAGAELRDVAREERPAAVLKAWEVRGLLEILHPQLARRHPDYEAIARLVKAREDLMAAGLRPRLGQAMIGAILGRLKPRERSSALGKLGFRASEVEAIAGLEDEALKTVKILAGRKTATPIEAYRFLEKLPIEQMAYILAESSNSKAVSKIRAYVNKWRPLRLALPTVATELEGLGFPRGPKFDAVVENVFALQLSGKGRTPEERVKLLRQLAGIKEPPKKKAKEEKKKASKQQERKAAREALTSAQEEKRAATAEKKGATEAAVTKPVASKHPAPAKKHERPPQKAGAKRAAAKKTSAGAARRKR